MAERKFFTGGLILLQLKDIKNIWAFIRQIHRLIYSAFKLTKDLLDEINATPDQYLDQVIKFFNCELKYPFKKNKAHNPK